MIKLLIFGDRNRVNFDMRPSSDTCSATRIPNYHLRAAHDAVPALKPTVRMGLRESLACARMKLWDESLGRMVGFPRPAARRT
jgi:hypothetical protein